jgi:hypothetical protein
MGKSLTIKGKAKVKGVIQAAKQVLLHGLLLLSPLLV